MRGGTFPFTASKELHREARITLALPDGSRRFIPVAWTDMAPPDPYLNPGGGRSRFRVEDLVALVELIAGIKHE